MGTKEVVSLKGRNARLGNFKPPYIRNSNHPSNTFQAGFMSYREGAYRAYDWAPGKVVEGLLFTQDVPIWMEVVTRYTGFTVPSEPDIITHVENPPRFFNAFAVAPYLVILDPVLPPYQQVLKGETYTRDLLVTGYGFSFTVDELGILTVLEPTDGNCTLKVITQAPQCYGPSLANISEGSTGTIYLPIILDEPDYTAAVQNDGNIITVMNGPTTYVYNVVGIFNKNEGSIGP
jgi:hypothetical protein